MINASWRKFTHQPGGSCPASGEPLARGGDALRRRRLARQSRAGGKRRGAARPQWGADRGGQAPISGVATNNVAEWTALVLGLEAAAKRGIRRLGVRLDSELVVRQLLGQYRVKHAALQPLHRRAQQLLRGFAEVDVRHVPRKQNALADRLVNRVLDQEAPKAAK